ncbi:hypothetical protein Tco_1146209 [Tanacetum coccineum]
MLKILLNDLKTKDVKIPQAEVNATLFTAYQGENELWVKYKALKAELAFLTQKIDAVSKNKSEKGLVPKSFDWDEESLSLEG